MQKCSGKFAAPYKSVMSTGVLSSRKGLYVEGREKLRGTEIHGNLQSFEHVRLKSQGILGWRTGSSHMDGGWRLEPDETGPHKKGESQTGA